MVDLASVFEELIGDLAKACGDVYADRLVSVAVFGSVATGMMRPDSDIDILIVVDPLPDGRLRRVEEFEKVEVLLQARLAAAAACADAASEAVPRGGGVAADRCVGHGRGAGRADEHEAAATVDRRIADDGGGGPGVRMDCGNFRRSRRKRIRDGATRGSAAHSADGPSESATRRHVLSSKGRWGRLVGTPTAHPHSTACSTMPARKRKERMGQRTRGGIGSSRKTGSRPTKR
jgi:predicted nucleotidyltransferase